MKRVTILFLGLAVLFLFGCQPQTTSAPSLIETDIDPSVWVSIPLGKFYSGQHAHEIEIPYDFEIMVTDVTNQQYAHFLNESFKDGATGFEGANPTGFYPGDELHGYKHEEEIPEGWYQLAALDDPNMRIVLEGQTYASTLEFVKHPVTLVTWFGARAFCEFYGWRLPTELEWEKAARGTDSRPFPWGEVLAPENANYYSSHDIFEKTFGKAGTTTPVGFYNGTTYEGFTTVDSPSPYGLYDMAGNVWQWTGDVYENQHYRYMRGGSKDTYGYNLRVWTRNSAGPEYYSPAVGFRCAREQ